MRTSRTVGLLLPIALLLSAAPISAQEIRKMAVLGIRAGQGIEKDTIQTIDEVLLSQFARSRRLEVLGTSDIAALLRLEEEKSLLASCNDEACLAELGGALGVPLLASCRLNELGDQYVISLKVLDVEEIKVVGRVSLSVDRTESELISGLQLVIADVIEQVTGESGLMATAGLRKEKPVTFMRVAPWVGLGLTAVAGGLGATFGALALKDADSAQAEHDGSLAWIQAHDAMEEKALTADILIGIAGAAAVTTLVLFLLGDYGDDSAPATAAGPTSLTIRF